MNINSIPKQYIIKFSKKEYLEQLKQGKIYFKESKFFKNIEENHIGDSREGKIKVNPNTIPKSEDIIYQIMRKTEELNFFKKKDDKTPIFCCSIIDDKIINIIDERHYDFRKEFIGEMKKWGNCFILINLDEFLYKLNEACKKQEIYYYANKVEYDQRERILTYQQAQLELTFFSFLSFYHKIKDYKWQNEFRITLLSKNKNKQIILENKDSIIIDIGPLKDAVIYEFYDLYNIGIKVIENNK